MVPTYGLSWISYEFPALIGGLIGCMVNSLIIKFKIGMREISDVEIKESGRSGRFAISSTSENNIIDAYKIMKASRNETDRFKDEEHAVEDSAKDSIEIVDGSKEIETSVVKNSMYHPNASSNIEKVEFLTEEEDEGLKAIQHFVGDRKSGCAYLWEIVGRTFPIWVSTSCLLTYTY